jgi:hypothetical protein
VKSNLPILLTEQGELSVVTDYLLNLEANGKSLATMNRVIYGGGVGDNNMHTEAF